MTAENVGDMETKVGALEPALIRVFFNSSALIDPGPDGVVRPDDAPRAAHGRRDQRHVAGRRANDPVGNMSASRRC